MQHFIFDVCQGIECLVGVLVLIGIFYIFAL